MFFIVYAFKGQVHVFAGQVKSCKSLVLQDKSDIELFLSLKSKCNFKNRLSEMYFTISGSTIASIDENIIITISLTIFEKLTNLLICNESKFG